MDDYRFKHPGMYIQITILAITVLMALYTPLYVVHVTSPSNNPNVNELETEYTLYCYAFNAEITNSDCSSGLTWNACYDVLNKINSGQCDSNKLVVGSENLESYSVYIDISTVLLVAFLAVGFISLFLVISPLPYKQSFHRMCTFFHFIACVCAIVIAHNTVTTLDETSVPNKHGIGQTPVVREGLVILCLAPLICLIVDNFNPSLF